MLFIGICGASGSGKTTLADELAKMANKSILIINQDAYYYDHPDMSFEDRCLLNYDEPGIFDHDLLLEDIRSLLSGKRVLRKRYDYANHRRTPQLEEYLEPHDVIIIEGIHAFYDERLRNLMDLKLYVRVDSDICLLRVSESSVAAGSDGLTGTSAGRLNEADYINYINIDNYVN